MTRKPQDVFNELLVLQCQGGDTAAMEVLARQWHPLMLRHAFRFTRRSDAAEEIAQDAWLAIVRGLDRLHDPAVFRGWVYRIVSNKARDWIRRTQARRNLTARVEREPVPASHTEGADHEGAIRRLHAALETLPEDRRALLSMHYLEEMGVQEISLALGVPAGTVKSRLFHARKQLKQCLADQRSPS